jgi:cation transporter-like permease
VDGYLPRVVTPIHYNLEITTNIYETQPPFPFSGVVEVFVTAIVQTNFVILNSLNLEIINIRIYADPDNEVRPPSPVLQQVTL